MLFGQEQNIDPEQMVEFPVIRSPFRDRSIKKQYNWFAIIRKLTPWFIIERNIFEKDSLITTFYFVKTTGLKSQSSFLQSQISLLTPFFPRLRTPKVYFIVF